MDSIGQKLRVSRRKGIQQIIFVRKMEIMLI